MKSSKAQIQSKCYKIPTIRFEDQRLTSFSGLLIFQLLFKRIDLKQRLKNCFTHLKVSPIFGRHLVVMLLMLIRARQMPKQALITDEKREREQ